MTQEQLKADFFYNRFTGVFRRRFTTDDPLSKEKWRSIKSPVIWFHGTNRRVPDLIWFYVTGQWPQLPVVFRSGKSKSLRFSNLHMQRRTLGGETLSIVFNPDTKSWSATLTVGVTTTGIGPAPSLEDLKLNELAPRLWEKASVHEK